jgi:peptide/nickel transport system permease protein
MLQYIVRRVLTFIPMFFLLSLISFAVIQLPPGSFVDTLVANMKSRGLSIEEAEIQRLNEQYQLDQPFFTQYTRWISNFLLKGDLGTAFAENRPVTEILSERVPLTMAISLFSIALIWLIAIPIGVYSATHQYSWGDYVITFIGLIGLSLPSFLFAIVLLWVIYSTTGFALTGLFSVQYIDAPWSVDKFIDLLKHIWMPIGILAITGTAGLIRVMRANLLDELGKQYVVTARSKGLEERRVLWKYPIRVALNPIVSTIGWLLPTIVGGESLVAIILNLRTVGPALLTAVRTQDMYLAGGIVMILSTLTLIGSLISDLLLAWLDPRIRYS